ncbi:DUF1853 family protein [Massilia glaciei]|uniref:DUF1853 domain-containing protein n=1 Tax=Massilia glaciei TaxID=1524097 RepID=A0A2U2HPD6_9BURK|nr:DUF1853 family protein [Massilia glaciei]PWF49380.1 DUF1853 domain-containing protein [Massilia glaciei]
MPQAADNYQALFAGRWGHLTRPHVRALAWLLDAPGLLDPADPHWQGKVAAPEPASAALAHWLARLEHDPAPLDAALGDRVHTRLGLYAEKLMAFYYQAHGRLVAHGLQVRASRNDTVGEFDFLLEAGPDAVEHIEFATKFYLLQGTAGSRFDTFLGPNLADSLGAKMRKIFDKQLVLSAHPAAQALLPRPVVRSRALVKGWLFYPAGAQASTQGILAAHCRGFWCAQDELGALEGERFVVLPRLEWLAPYRTDDAAATLGPAQLQAAVAEQFALSPAPLLVASVRAQAGGLVEAERGFVVPNDWRARAVARFN